MTSGVKRGFLPFGAMIATTLATGMLEKLIKLPQVPVTRENASVVQPYIEQAARDVVREELRPRLEHLTNNEPWYQSRVTIGLLISGFSGLLAIAGYNLPPENQTQLVEVVVTFGPMVLPLLGACITWVGRWAARKPIGEE